MHCYPLRPHRRRSTLSINVTRNSLIVAHSNMCSGNWKHAWPVWKPTANSTTSKRLDRVSQLAPNSRIAQRNNCSDDLSWLCVSGRQNWRERMPLLFGIYRMHKLENERLSLVFSSTCSPSAKLQVCVCVCVRAYYAVQHSLLFYYPLSPAKMRQIYHSEL